MLCLHERAGRRVPDKPERGRLGVHAVSHFALRIEDEKAWEAKLEEEGLPIFYDSPVRWPHSTAWYVEDPSGYQIEVAHWKQDQVVFG